MMLYPSINELSEKTDSRYTLVTLAAKRARDIIDGKPVLTEVESDRPVSLATNEIAEDLITYRRVTTAAIEEPAAVSEDAETPEEAKPAEDTETPEQAEAVEEAEAAESEPAEADAAEGEAAAEESASGEPEAIEAADGERA